MFKSLAKIMGGSNEGVIKKIMPVVEEINELEPEFEALDDEELEAKTFEFKARLNDDQELDDLLPEAFAAVREAAKRTLGQRHFDVQLMGGIVLHQGKIAEMKTGEGKTLVATLAAYLNALPGLGVHIVTVNDYLARRDAQWMGAIYHLLGLSVGTLQHQTAYLYDPSVQDDKQSMNGLRRVDRKQAYQADITYGTNNEFGFDYLRDNMVVELGQCVQRELSFTIVDEVDNILIDEARTPLIISGPAEQSPKEYYRFARMVPSLMEDEDYTLEEKHRTVSLTNEGMGKLEKMLSIQNLYDSANFAQVHFIENALKAQNIYQRDREYVVSNGEVVIVDEFTGRLMHGRRYSDGLHQAIEAKEGVNVQRESITYATITLQNYFRLYKKIAGMTGTAATEAEEFWKIYKLDVDVIPTNMPMIRKDNTDLVYRDQKAKYQAIVEEITNRHSTGQPVLVGTTDIEKSERLSDMLKRNGVPHEVLNAKQHEREAAIVAHAGAEGAVTVATNMAGRGTDIVLGGSTDDPGIGQKEWESAHEKIIGHGGLFIIGTERHEARRIDNQLRGRSGRQGDPGNTLFYVALDDSLMRRFGGDRIRSIMDWAGFDDDTPIENKMVSKTLEGAQVKVEAFHFDMRKHLVEYDDVVNTHRDVIYGERNKILGGADLKSNIQAIVEQQIRDTLDDHLIDTAPASWDTHGLISDLSTILMPPQELSDPVKLSGIAPDEIELRMLGHAEQVYEDMERTATADVMRTVESQLMLRAIDTNWISHLTAMENLRQGIGLHAYGQRDPLVMYKKEGHDMFQSLQARVQHDISRTIFHLGIPQAGGTNSAGDRQKAKIIAKRTAPNVMAPALGNRSLKAAPQENQKVGRNATCPCGSGKKYKRCHGA